MIKNVIFDIGNVILNFNINEVLRKFTNSINERKRSTKYRIETSSQILYN